MNGPKTGKIPAWLKIARLQFYPMSWLAYSLGSVSHCVTSGGRFDLSLYVVGYLILFLIEFCTVLANEYFDYETDSRNRNGGLFTGGTRVLIDGWLSFRDVRIGIFTGLALVFALGALLLVLSPAGSIPVITFLLMAGLVLGIGYTVPPLKFSYRGCGEIVVGLTHSFYLIVCGSVFQGGSWDNPVPWLLGVPLFFAVLGTNTLAGIPDRKADGAVLKGSIAVLFGPRAAVAFAIGCVCTACFSGVLLIYLRLFPVSFANWTLLVIPHGLLLLLFLFRLLRSRNYEGRIDGVMGLALTYIIWFGLLPIIAIW